MYIAIVWNKTLVWISKMYVARARSLVNILLTKLEYYNKTVNIKKLKL